MSGRRQRSGKEETGGWHASQTPCLSFRHQGLSPQLLQWLSRQLSAVHPLWSFTGISELTWISSPWPATHYLLEQPTRGSPRVSFWPCHRTTVLSPARFGQPVEQAFLLHLSVSVSSLCPALLLFSYLHPEFLKKNLCVDLQRTQLVTGLQTRKYQEKEAEVWG